MLCVECEYHTRVDSGVGTEWDGCTHPSTLNLVTGEPAMCVVNRMSGSKCGKTASMFKAKSKDQIKRVDSTINDKTVAAGDLRMRYIAFILLVCLIANVLYNLSR